MTFNHDLEIEKRYHPENFEPQVDRVCVCGHNEEDHSTGPKQVCLVSCDAMCVHFEDKNNNENYDD